MGCGQSAPVEDTAAKQRHEEIEKQLKKAEKEVCKLPYRCTGIGVSQLVPNLTRMYTRSGPSRHQDPLSGCWRVRQCVRIFYTSAGNVLTRFICFRIDGAKAIQAHV